MTWKRYYNQIDATMWPDIVSFVTVEDSFGAPIANLTAADFEVYEDNVLQSPITVVPTGGGGTAIAVAMALDTSGSIASSFAEVQAAATTFINQLQPADRAALISFDVQPRLDVALTSDFTALVQAINGLSATGAATAIYDTVIFSVNEIIGAGGRKAVILLTDGADNNSSASLDDAIAFANSAGYPVYVIGLDLVQGGTPEQNMQRLATETGGQYFRAPTAAEVESVYLALSQQLNNQYEIAYQTTHTQTDGSLATVEITAYSMGQFDKASKTYVRPLVQLLNLTYSQVDTAAFPDIVSYVSVADDAGAPLVGLTESNFIVQEDGVSISPFTVAPVGAASIAVTLAIDRSGSMSGDIVDAKAAAVTFVNQMQPGDLGAVVSFSSSATVDQPLTADKSALTSAINSISTGGGTAIYDSVLVSVNEISAAAGRRAVILLTDGADGGGGASLPDAIAYANNASTPIFVVGLGLPAGSLEETAMEDLANGTGGQYLRAPTAAEVEGIYQLLAAQLSNQYVISYTTPNPNLDGSTSTVAITANYAGATDTEWKQYTRAGGGGVNVSIEGAASVAPGSVFPVTVSVAQAVTDMDTASFELQLAPTGGVFEYDHFEATGTLFDGASVIDNAADPAKMIFVLNLPGFTGVSGQGELLRVYFRTVGALNTQATFTLASVLLGDTLANAIPSQIVGLPLTVDVNCIPGDANGDGSVDNLDITKIERIIAGWDPVPAGGCVDANQDGAENVLDITATERLAAGLAAVFVAAPNTETRAGLLYVEPVVEDQERVTLMLGLTQPLAGVDTASLTLRLPTADYVIEEITFADGFEGATQLRNDEASTVTYVVNMPGLDGTDVEGPLASLRVRRRDAARPLPLGLEVLVGDTEGRAMVQRTMSVDLPRIPTETAVLPNYPNPFNPETWIPFELADASDVRVTIYDASGSKMRALDLGHLPPGVYARRGAAAHWDGRNEAGELVSSGVYFYRVDAGAYSTVGRMAILK